MEAIPYTPERFDLASVMRGIREAVMNFSGWVVVQMSKRGGGGGRGRGGGGRGGRRGGRPPPKIQGGQHRQRIEKGSGKGGGKQK